MQNIYTHINMKRINILSFLYFTITFLSCTSAGNINRESNSDRNPDKAYRPSKDLYNKTFDEIDHFISELNDIIRNQDYDAWVNCLTKNYILEKSDPHFLENLSDEPTLKEQKIKLTTIKEYFMYVIVPSRAKPKLEKIVFIDKEHVKALSTYFGETVVLFYIEKVDGTWKMGNRK
jgi:hypothetical protein